ncbi:hypothetical protein DFH06DRAFT_1145652 [Mycena polygramma]|nr:hypothetical protein DFH06DRAFT_1145652 [Mycena polygramma]
MGLRSFPSSVRQCSRAGESGAQETWRPLASPCRARLGGDDLGNSPPAHHAASLCGRGSVRSKQVPSRLYRWATKSRKLRTYSSALRCRYPGDTVSLKSLGGVSLGGLAAPDESDTYRLAAWRDERDSWWSLRDVERVERGWGARGKRRRDDGRRKAEALQKHRVAKGPPRAACVQRGRPEWNGMEAEAGRPGGPQVDGGRPMVNPGRPRFADPRSADPAEADRPREFHGHALDANAWPPE